MEKAETRKRERERDGKGKETINGGKDAAPGENAEPDLLSASAVTSEKYYCHKYKCRNQCRRWWLVKHPEAEGECVGNNSFT